MDERMDEGSKQFVFGVVALCVIALTGVWLGSCGEPDYSQMNTQTQEKKVDLVKVHFYDGHTEVFQYEYCWNDGEGKNARLHIDGDEKDVYIKFEDVQRYEKYTGYRHEITKSEATQ